MKWFTPKPCLTCAAKDAEITRLSNLLITERQLSDSLTRQMLTDVMVMRRDGFVATNKPQPLAPVPAPEPLSELETVIQEYEEKAPKGANVRRGLELYVAREKAKGTPERDILIGIHRGGSYVEDDDS